MAETTRFLAIDLGVESGRAVVGEFDGERLVMQEIHRFINGPVQVLDRLHWDVLRLWSEIKRGFGLAAESNRDLVSVGLDCDGYLTHPPRCRRCSGLS